MVDTQNHLSPGAAGGLGAASRVADQEGLLDEEQALTAAQQQVATIDTAASAESYQSGLAIVVAAKYEQVGRIQDRLEGQIETQESRLQGLASNRPGLLSRPGARQAWQTQQMRQQQVLQRLNARLESVREIRDSMGMHGPKLQELAERRFRMREPELAMGWDDMRATQRGHEAVLRKQEQEQRRGQEQRQGRGMSLSHSLTGD